MNELEIDGLPPLTDAEIEEIDQLLATISEDFDPLDVSMMDGFITGVILNPADITEAQWLPLIYDVHGRPDAQPENPERARELIQRRWREIASAIAARDYFDPVIFPLADETTDEPITDASGIPALEPWAVGFMNALDAFPGVLENEDNAVLAAVAGILRHLPSEEKDVELEKLKTEIGKEVPLADLDEALEHLVMGVLDTADITRPRTPQRRETPKVGRNDPCPCGSGKKYKACCGQ